MVSLEDGNAEVAGIEPAAFEDETGKGPDAGAASLEDTDDKVARVEPAGFDLGQGKAAGAGIAAPKYAKSSDSSTGASTPEDEADYVMSIAWRDL
jgi:hypothetical protein